VDVILVGGLKGISAQFWLSVFFHTHIVLHSGLML
jgi:hypothetical protein